MCSTLRRTRSFCFGTTGWFPTGRMSKVGRSARATTSTRTWRQSGSTNDQSEEGLPRIHLAPMGLPEVEPSCPGVTAGGSGIGATSSLPDALGKVPPQSDLPTFVIVRCRPAVCWVHDFRTRADLLRTAQVAGSASIGDCRPPTSPPRGGCHAASELEGLLAPLTGVLSDLSLARDNTNEVDPPASRLAADGRARRCHRGRQRGGALAAIAGALENAAQIAFLLGG